ncbi:flagellar L-ring protein precursor FlgH [Roseateles sp. YR242]|uniref:flagellar basal body L-ring protein FlgH n=1 Tax=Roseateles sp. YR242 TaxID=1855305 RepID=UPI0008AF421B|nr:flagellar basal body L-ring protein FlgH [Roseateles sp. YR242]SEL44672.1 flagellar L-ring protein precursor FlgH [Roseateles sp. YR242]
MSRYASRSARSSVRGSTHAPAGLSSLGSVVRSAVIGLSVPAITLLSACSTPYPQPRVDMQPAPVVKMPEPIPASANNGAIYQNANFRPLFEDHRARLVGDIVTVTITEKVSASQKSSSELDKTGSLAAAVTAIPGIAAGSFGAGRAEVGGTSTNKNTGKGTNENTNDFSGTITAVVTGVLPNGHLLISGEKQVGVNNNVDVLRFFGQVDPQSIRQGNLVPSTAIANVRVEQRGRGAVADAHSIGWLSRFFLNLSPT